MSISTTDLTAERQVLEKELEKKHNNIDERLSKFISDLYYDEDQKRA